MQAISDIDRDLSTLEREFNSALESATTKDELQEIKISFLGKKGRLTSILRTIGGLSPEERAAIGSRSNVFKSACEEKLQILFSEIDQRDLAKTLSAESIDITFPGRSSGVGHLHPITQALDRVVRIFSEMGYDVAEGPQIETEHYNFEALNIPKHHPARDMQDTFYVKDGRVLRTHTSPVQIHYMESHQPPFQMIAPGKVYRRDSDVSHTPMFHQVEGLVVSMEASMEASGRGLSAISMSHLKGTLEFFVRAFFQKPIEIRLRPSYFPFTEPSCEVDIQCVLCGGSGCPVCKQSGWLEVMGAGMVHPKVFEAVGYDPEKVTGFAFGMGIERLAMLKYKIDDIRLFYQNDLKFLGQF